MNKYEQNVFYIGNLIEYKNSKPEKIKEKLCLIYNKEKDKFISFIDTYYLSLDLISSKLSEKEKNDILKLIAKYSYSYIPSQIEGDKYIDENSIQLLSTVDIKKSRN